MRVDSCRKCGEELREYTQPENCAICGKECAQFICIKCNDITDPQYHMHKAAIEASPLSH